MARKKTKKIGKPNVLIWAVGIFILNCYFKLVLNVHVKKYGVKEIESPSLIMAPHLSDMDPFMVAAALYPIRPTFVVSYHFYHDKHARPWLRLAHAISKKMFCPDISAARDMLRANKEGNSIVIFPEGRESCNSETNQIADGTVDLIKKLGVDVHMFNIDGAYKSYAKWGRYKRHGRIELSVHKMLTKEQIQELSKDEIYEVLDKELYHDDEKVLLDTPFKCKDMTLGLDSILHRCPSCLQENLSASKGHITCECGLDATLDSYYKLHGVAFETVNQWYRWQESQIDVENDYLESQVLLGAVGSDEIMHKNVGSGIMRMDFDTISFQGTLWDEPFSFIEKTSTIKAFPVSVHDHFSMFHDGRLLYVHVTPDVRMVTKWVYWLDKITKVKNNMI